VRVRPGLVVKTDAEAGQHAHHRGRL